jgi:hypothetical protein
MRDGLVLLRVLAFHALAHAARVATDVEEDLVVREVAGKAERPEREARVEVVVEYGGVCAAKKAPRSEPLRLVDTTAKRGTMRCDFEREGVRTGETRARSRKCRRNADGGHITRSRAPSILCHSPSHSSLGDSFPSRALPIFTLTAVLL